MHDHIQINKQDLVFPLKLQFCLAGEGKGPQGMPSPTLPFTPLPSPPPKMNVLGMQVSLKGGEAKAQDAGELPSERF